jgi:hypothetical protein
MTTLWAQSDAQGFSGLSLHYEAWGNGPRGAEIVWGIRSPVASLLSDIRACVPA